MALADSSKDGPVELLCYCAGLHYYCQRPGWMSQCYHRNRGGHGVVGVVEHICDLHFPHSHSLKKLAYAEAHDKAGADLSGPRNTAIMVSSPAAEDVAAQACHTPTIQRPQASCMYDARLGARQSWRRPPSLLSLAPVHYCVSYRPITRALPHAEARLPYHTVHTERSHLLWPARP